MLIDFGSRTIQIKIVFYGPAMSGKSTALNYLFKKFNSQLISINTSHVSDSRTLFYDYGYILMNIGKWALKLNLWSATGQDFYCMTRSTVLQGTDGIMFMGDSQRKHFEGNLKSYHELKEFFKNKLERNIPVVACLNKRDLDDLVSIEHFKDSLNLFPNTKVFETVARDNVKNIYESFKLLFEKILEIHSDIYQTIKKEINFNS